MAIKNTPEITLASGGPGETTQNFFIKIKCLAWEQSGIHMEKLQCLYAKNYLAYKILYMPCKIHKLSS